MKTITKILIAITLVITMISCGGVPVEDCTQSVKDHFPNAEIYTNDCLGSNISFIVVDTTKNKIFRVKTNNVSNPNITSIVEMCKIQ